MKLIEKFMLKRCSTEVQLMLTRMKERPEDFIVVSSRFNDDVEGYWVTGQLRVADDTAGQPVSVAVAIGWAATEDEALGHYRRVRDEIRVVGEALAESLGVG